MKKHFCLIFILALLLGSVACSDDGGADDPVDETPTPTPPAVVVPPPEVVVPPPADDGENQNLCSAENPAGTCAEGESCIGGNCLALCSQTKPDGYCAEGTTCTNGVCVEEVKWVLPKVVFTPFNLSPSFINSNLIGAVSMKNIKPVFSPSSTDSDYLNNIMNKYNIQKVVEFPDSNLREAVIKAALYAINFNWNLDNAAKTNLKSKLAEGTITVAHCLLIKQLDAQVKDIQNLAGIQYLTNLTWIYFNGNNKITDYSVLASLTNLETLYLMSSQIKDISTLKGLTSLNVLYLNCNQIVKISELKGLKSLKTLFLPFNKITDISALEDLDNITDIDLSSNPLSSIAPLLNMAGLEEVWLEKVTIVPNEQFVLDTLTNNGVTVHQ